MPTRLAQMFTAIAMTLIVGVPARAADVTVQPASGSGFVVKDAAGANERLRVQESGAIALPGVPGAAAQSTSLCMSGAGLLGPCSGGPGGGNSSTYTASTGLNLAGTAFSVAPTYQLPQGCAANQIAQWNGAAWACADASAGGATLPAGTVGQTLRYDSSNALVANNMLFAFADGGLLATGAEGTGSIPETGAGTRMMWYPNKAAFRAGKVGGTEWDDGNIGLYSIAMGQNAKASNSWSIAMGPFATASGSGAIALGASLTASGPSAIALGSTTTASGEISTAMGSATTAKGDFSTAMGNTTTASGKNSIAMGMNVTADGDNSIAMGSYAGSNGFANSFIWSNGASQPNPVMNDAPGQFFVNGTSKFVGYMHVVGKLGVDTDLEVDGNGSFNALVSSDNWFDAADGVKENAQFGISGNFASIYVPNGYVVSPGFYVLSDARIKSIAGRSDPTRDLATLNAIEVTDYTMKDRAHFGDQRHKKVIAQQVEQVLPQLVSKHTGFIPDVYKVAGKVEPVEGGYKLGFDAPHGIARTAKKLKLMPEGRSALEQADVLAVPSDTEVVIKASGWTAERVFVYGEEVDDLRTVDYEGLTTLNVSATQELSKRLDAQQTRQSQLTAQLVDRDAQIEALRSDLAAQTARVAALESVAGDLATLSHEFAQMRTQLQALQSQPHDSAAPAASPRRGHGDTLVAAARP